MTTIQETQTWKGKKVVDADGDKFGTIEEIFLDRHTGDPAWATVKTGLFGLKSSFVPLAGAQPTDDDELRIPIDKQLVKDAPKVEADGELTPEEERRLWQHYGRSDYVEWQGDDKTTALAELEDEPFGEPAIVGVRLRRVLIVTVPASDDR